MLTKPPYIARAQLANNVLQYEWDEWRVQDFYRPADDDLVKRLSVLSSRANVAFTIAMGEWGVFRFEKVSDDPMPLQYLEATWAGNIHAGYCHYIETDDDEWRGIVRGPLNIIMAIVIDILWGYKEHCTPGENPAWMSKLVEHILPDTTHFLDWREQVIVRLENHFLAPEDDPDDLFEDKDYSGTPVPRELFNIDLPFDPSQTDTFLDNFLRSLDWKSNLFLRTPDELKEFSYIEGTPYRYNK